MLQIPSRDVCIPADFGCRTGGVILVAEGTVD